MSRRYGAWVLATFVFALVVAADPGAAQSGSRLLLPEGNVNVSKITGSQAETTVAIDPTDVNRVFIGSNVGPFAAGGSGSGIFAAFSTDGGRTWSPSAAASGVTLPAACCDPVARFDQFGNLFYSYLARDDRIHVTLSTDGGRTFSLLQSFTGNDYPRMDTGPDGSGQGSVWIVWENNSLQVVGARVRGLGLVDAFTTPVEVPGTGTGSGERLGQFGDIAVGPSGQVFVPYQTDRDSNPCTNAGEHFGNTDPDGLGSQGFGQPVKITDTTICKFRAIPPQPRRTIDSDVKAAWDRRGGGAGTLYVSYTTSPSTASDNSDVFVRRSTNAGASWSAPVKVNDDNTSTSQFFPSIAVDQTSGNLAVCFYDPRNDPNNNVVTQFFCADSTNGGQSFNANVRMSQGSSNATGFAVNPNEYGDYTGTAFHNGLLITAWGDNSNFTGDNPSGALGDLDILSSRATLSTSTVTPTPASPTPTPSTGTITGSVTSEGGGGGGLGFFALFFGGGGGSSGPQPVSGATVRTATGQQATTGSDGRYSITGVPAGPATVTATTQQSGGGFLGGGAPTTVNCTTPGGQTEAQVTVPGGAAVNQDFTCPSGGGGGFFGFFGFPLFSLFGGGFNLFSLFG